MNDNNDRKIIIEVLEIGDNNDTQKEDSKVISFKTYSNLNTENSAEAYSERKPASMHETFEESFSDKFLNEYPITIYLN